MRIDRLFQRAFVAVPVAVGVVSAQSLAAGHAPAFGPAEALLVGALALVASLPAGAGPLGLLTPPAEGVPSAVQSVAASLRSLAGAPARAKAARQEQRFRQIQEAIRRDAVRIAGEMVKTGEFVMTPLGLAPAHPKAEAPAPSVPAGAQPGSGLQSVPMPAPGYGYAVRAPEVPAAAPRTLSDGPQAIPAAPDASTPFVTGADAQSAFNQPQG